MDFDGKFDRREPNYAPTQKQMFAALEAVGVSCVKRLAPLSGGFRNTSYRVSASDAPDRVLRICGGSERDFEAEISILDHLGEIAPVPTVEAFQINNADLGRHFAVLGFLPGRLLCAVEDQMSPSEIEEIGSDIGRCLAKIHAVKFGRSGFFGKGLEVIEPFSSFYDGYCGYMQKCLSNPLLKDRLGKNVFDNLTAFISDNLAGIRSLKNTTFLTHSDFNQKNLLVSRDTGTWKLTGFLDWEFAFSGSPLVDFGNFFRYRGEMDPHYRTPLTTSYRESGGDLPENWEAAARFLDLLSMMMFLTREGDFPKTFETARSVVISTLQKDHGHLPSGKAQN